MVYKKYLALFLAFSLFSLPGCVKKNPNHIEITDDSNAHTDPSDNDRTVILSELGLKYTTPDAWREYETTNIYPVTLAGEGFFAQIVYNFVKEEDLATLNDTENQGSKSDFLYPICQIVMFDKANLDTVGVQAVLNEYEVKEELTSENNYVYYVLSNYQGDLSALNEKDKEKYNKLVSAVPELTKSASTFAFDENELKTNTEKLEGTISFDTMTLKGEAINSTVFAAYDLTMLNFGATYATDESKVLEEVQKKIKAEPSKKLHLLTAYIDTPETETTETGKKLRLDADASYETIVMDETIGSWVQNHLNGVPTTIFVDANGQIVGEMVEGAKTADEYWTLLNQTLESLK